MRKIILLLACAALLSPAAMVMANLDQAVVQSAQEAPALAEIEGTAPAAVDEAEALVGNSCQAEAPLPLSGPTPVPNYCTDCVSCSSDYECGMWGGRPMGDCSPPPNSWCPGTTGSVCICY